MSRCILGHARHPVEMASSVSGRTIVVEADPTLDVWSSVRLPKQTDKQSHIAYRPEYTKYLDYLVAHECGHIYRFFSARPEERLVPAGTPHGLKKATRQLAAEEWDKKHLIPKYKMDEFLTDLCTGLVRQLLNTPVDCRIEAWMHDSFPELRDVQASALQELYQIAAWGLKRELQGMFPPFIYDRSNAMNYVMMKHVGRLLGRPKIVFPYVKAGYGELGERLDSYLEKDDKGYIGDVRTADAWARELGIRGWYEWRKPQELGS